jgi:hypothetical protein
MQLDARQIILPDGRSADVFVGRWLADRIPGASFNMAPGHGHLSLPIAYRDEILQDLLSVASA